MREKFHPRYDYTVAEVVWAVRREIALTVEDVLARQVCLLLVDVVAAMEAAGKVAEIIARERGKNTAWAQGN